jgi:integrase
MDSTDIDKTTNGIVGRIENPILKKEVEDYLFIRERIDKVRPRTRRNDAQALLSFDKFLNKKSKDYQKVTQDDMLQWEKFLEEELNLKSSSLSLYEIHVKRFYKYLSNKKEYKRGKRFQKNIPYPDCVSWISVITRGNNHKLPIDKLLDHDGLMKMLNACDNIRDQAMIIGFLDGGLRNSELVSLNVESLGFDKLGAYFILPKDENADLKTGMRKIRLFLVPSSTQYMKEHINKHPYKNYDKAPLFFTRDNRFFSPILRKANNGTINQSDFETLRLSRLSVKDIIKKIAKRASVPIEKPHDLRHNSCTLCSKAGFNEAELRIRYGWSPTSKMPSRYTHLASKDLDDKIKLLTGFKEPEKPEDDILQPIICWNCQEENVPTNKFCGKCSANLNPTKEEMTISATETGLATQEMLKDAGFRDFYNDMLLATWEKYKERKEKK